MGKKKSKISVIMVTYNRKKYLVKSLESILSQSFSNFELILINNGSSDGTGKLCREYAKKDSRIKIINIKENKGASRGRNIGIDSAVSEYITIVDDDDYCEKGMLEHLVNLANEYNADISMCGSYNNFGDRLEPYFIFDNLLVLDKVQALDELLRREKYNVAPPTKLFRKNLFEGFRFPEGVLVDDIHVIYKVFAKANMVVAKGKPLYHFRKHKSNMTRFIQSNSLTPELLNEYLSMYKERTRYLLKKVPEITARARYSEWAYMISMCNKIKKYNCKNCEEQYMYMKNQLISTYKEIIKSSFITKEELVILQNIIC
ncbi:glycosyltransferase family 2 protein [Clostridium sporogenes]|uniref:glycosyltransferase family 2 protein n=2 Tax=Clostridium sporogenes TaxID=1509 RepID=UPI00024BA08A|nr:glycosyltransferase family 2 protein [Clostridium sporogenes]EHN13938.1 glycosyl transferase family protein [Clostridium sporogenes PA 3679]KYN77474.1 glycosyl transferase [Clostridium sporogenes]MDU4598210.1 glycosyltransferase family 2 protein [Clostridium sporogenes]NFF67582.1 glycosyltransferase family 2 protein [Clostridium sporogenes]NFF97787.1 glycosyltransferase family 2 protein [Clostridium sporogenes]